MLWAFLDRFVVGSDQFYDSPPIRIDQRDAQVVLEKRRFTSWSRPT